MVMTYGRRRSARLSAMGDTMKAQQATSEEFEAFLEDEEIQQEQVDVDGSQPRPESKSQITKVYKKKRKLRPVDDVLGNNSNGALAQEVDVEQGRENLKHESQSNNGKLPAEPLASQIPEKRLLKLVIDILQKKDSHDIFAEPVDPTEVEGYYEVIKEPMDFFTMKEKVQQGTYTSLEQFEHDIFLIFDNAMLFNAENTVFYRQARSIHALAKKVIHTLRTDPENFELEFSTTRKRPGRKSKCEARNSTPALQAVVSTGARTNRITPAFDSNGEGARSTYRPWTSFLNENESLVSDLSNYSKPLLPANNGGLGYRESLMQFVEGLGPTAEMVAQRKLQNLVLPTNHQIPASSGQGRLIPQNSAEIVPTIQNAFHRSSDPSTNAHFGDGVHIRDTYRSNMGHQRESFKLPVHRDLNLPPNDGLMESDSYLAMMVDACHSKTKAWPDESASQARLHELDSTFSRKNSSSQSSLFPFQAMRAPNLRQRPSSSIHGLESHSQGMAEQRQSYDMSLAQQIRSSVLPSLRVPPSMHGIQLSRPSPASAISPQAGLVMEGHRQASMVLPSGVEYQTGTPSESNYVVSSSPTVPFPERNQSSSLMRSQHSLLGQNQGLAELSRMSNRVNSSSELRSSSYPLNVGNQNIATPSWNRGLTEDQRNAHPDTDQNKCSHHSPIWGHPSMQCMNSSFLYGEKQVINAPVLPPTSSYGIIKSLQPSSYKLLDSQYGDAHQVVNAPAMPSYGIVDSVQPNSLLEWNQPKIWGAEAASSNGIYLQPYDNGMKTLWEQNGLAQPEPLRLGPSGSDATSMQIYARDTMQNQQAELNTDLALLHNQESDVALKLSLSEQIYGNQS